MPAKSERRAFASWKPWRHLMCPKSSPTYRQSRSSGRCGRGTSSPVQRAAASPPESVAHDFARSAAWWRRGSHRVALRRGGALSRQERDELDGLYGPPHRDLRPGRPALGDPISTPSPSWDSHSKFAPQSAPAFRCIAALNELLTISPNHRSSGSPRRVCGSAHPKRLRHLIPHVPRVGSERQLTQPPYAFLCREGVNRAQLPAV